MATNLPYIVNGTITDTDATNPNNAKVVLRNDRNGNETSTTTNSSGQYVLDAANITGGYVQTDRLTVICGFGNANGESSFLISDDIHTVDITLTTRAASSSLIYFQVQDILDELGDKTTDDISYDRIVRNGLRAEADIDERAGTKFTSTTVTQEIYDFNQYTGWKSPEMLINRGSELLTNQRRDFMNASYLDRFKLNNSPILSITTLEKNNAAVTEADDWETLTEQTGSGGDFVVDKDIGTVTFIKSPPIAARKRQIRVTYTYGSSSVPKTVERLGILLTIKSILSSKANSSQFDSVDDIALEGISIKKGVSGTVNYLNDIRKEIEELWAQVGDFISKTA